MAAWGTLALGIPLAFACSAQQWAEDLGDNGSVVRVEVQLSDRPLQPEQEQDEASSDRWISDEERAEQPSVALASVATVRVGPVEQRETDRGHVEDSLLTTDHIIIQSVDGRGRVIAERAAIDPRLVRVETFREGEAARTLPREGSVEIDMPYSPDANELRVYRVRWDGTEFQRVLDARTPFPFPGVATGVQPSEGVRQRRLERTPGNIDYRGRIPITINGTALEKIDIVLIGDGYTAGEMKKWEEDAKRITDELFALPMFCYLGDYFNVYRIDVVSAQSGAGTGRPYSRRNALGSYLGCSGVDRLLCLDYNAAESILSRAAAPYEREIVVIVANDSRYGGSGGRYASTTSSAHATRTLAHELGHSFAGLGDEYSFGRPDSQCLPGREPPNPNITIERDANNVKWKAIEGTGLFEGANYCKKNYYRPYATSIMRSLDSNYQALHIDIWRTRVQAISSGTPRTSCAF